MHTVRVPLWVERKEKELRLCEGTTELEGFGFAGKVARVIPEDDLTSAERQQAEDLILKAERAADQALLQKALAMGAPVLL
jgi:hypothetical protein